MISKTSFKWIYDQFWLELDIAIKVKFTLFHNFRMAFLRILKGLPLYKNWLLSINMLLIVVISFGYSSYDSYDFASIRFEVNP